MAKTTSMKIKADGEADFKKALANINSDMRVLGSELKMVASQFDKNDTSIEKHTAKNQVLEKEIEKQKEKIELLNKARSESVEKFGEDSEAAKKWQIQINNATTALNAMERDVKKNNAAIEEERERIANLENGLDGLGDEARDTAGDFDKLDGEMSQSGKTADDASGKFEGAKKAAAAMGKALAVSVAAIGTAAVAAGKKLWDLSNDVAKTGDEIDKNSQKVGISAEAYQEWSYVFERSGANIDGLQGGMKKLSTVITDAANGSDKAAEKLKAVGLSVADLNGKSQEEQLSLVITALQGMESGATRTAAATKLFGNSATDMAAVLNMTAKDTEALKKEAQDYGMVMSNDAVAASAEFEDKLTKLNGTLGGVKNRLIGDLLPGITSIVDGLADLAAGKDGAEEKITEGVSSVIESIQGMAPQLITLLKSIGKALLNSLLEILKSLMDAIIDILPTLIPEIFNTAVGLFKTLATNILPQLIKSLLSTLKTLIAAVTQALPELIKAVAQALPEIIKAITDALPDLIAAIVEALPVLIDAIIDALPDLIPAILEGAMSIILAVAEALPGLIQSIVEKLPELIDTIISALVDTIPDLITALLLALPTIIDGLMQLVLAIVDALPQIITSLLSAMPKIISAVIDALIQCLPQLIDGAIELILGLVEHLPEIIFGIIEAVPTIIVKVGEALVKAAPKLIQGAITLVAKLVEKIPEICKKLFEKIPEIISKIAAKLGEGLSQIVEAGKNIVFGLWEGITGAAQWLWDKITGWLSELWGNILGFFGIHSPSTKARDMLGKNIVKGLAEGVLDEGRTAVDAMKDIADDILGVDVKTPKIDASGLKTAVSGAIGTVTVDGAVQGAAITPAPIYYNVEIRFGDVTMANDMDIQTVANRISDIFAQRILVKGGAFA